jgi:glutathione peroxidase
MRQAFCLAVLFAFAAALVLRALPARAEDKKPASALDFTVEDIDGKKVDLSQYKGKVVMIVNVASKCGNTPQYKQLQEAWEKNKDKGLVILGFPANEFGKQEPGTNAQIKEFCTKEYDVTFPMFSKIVVKGEGIHPLYQYLTSKETDPKFGGDIEWNFAKFIVGRDGQVVARFPAKTKPDAKEVVAKLDEELAKPAAK